jgi:hypothetical protein
MPDIDVKAYIEQLRKVLPYVPPIAVEKIKALYEKGDLGGVVKVIRNTMNINVHLILHWTSGLHYTSEHSATFRPNAPAWIERPEKMPYYGTDAFKEMKVDLFITKEFAGKAPYYQFAIAVAHELSHVGVALFGYRRSSSRPKPSVPPLPECHPRASQQLPRAGYREADRSKVRMSLALLGRHIA